VGTPGRFLFAPISAPRRPTERPRHWGRRAARARSTASPPT